MLLASGMDPRTSIGILAGVTRRGGEEVAAEFDKLKSRFEKLYKARNIVAHSRWGKGKRPKSIGATNFKSVGDIRQEYSEYTALELIALAHRIYAFRRDLSKFMRRHGLWLQTSPEKPEV